MKGEGEKEEGGAVRNACMNTQKRARCQLCEPKRAGHWGVRKKRNGTRKTRGGEKRRKGGKGKGERGAISCQCDCWLI